MTKVTKQPINSGFLLSRQSYDKGGALVITLWLKTDKSVVKLQINNEFAMFFVENNQAAFTKQLLINQNIELAKSQALNLKTFTQEKVHGFYFKTLRYFYRARELLKNNGIKCYEDDIRPDDRFLMERFITADIDFIGESNQHRYYEQIDNVKCKPSIKKKATALTMLSIDIECSMTGALYSIGLYANNVVADKAKEFKRVLMIGKPQLAAPSYITWLENEKQLLEAFIDEVMQFDADIFIGWNVINFDFRLLQKRFDLYRLPFAIGRDGSSPHWRKNSNNTEQHFIEIAGRVVLDGIDLLKTATYNFPSFSLDNIAHSLLGIGKKVTDVDNRVQEITDNFNHNKPALAAYNLEDCRLVWLIFEKTQLLEFAQLRAQLTGLAIDRVGGSVAAFTNLYLPKLHRSGYVAPNMGDGASDLVSPGGYVMDSIPGLYRNILVLDFKSLYPSIIRSFNIDPMGLIEGLSEGLVENATDGLSKKCIPGFDGAYFSRTKHFLPDIIESLWLERDKAKRQKNSALSQAIKIIMNSFYGILGSTGCRFFDPRLSGSITKRSHEILKTTKIWIEARGHQVIYGDTDSIFVSIGLDKSSLESQQLGSELAKFINNKWQQVLAEKFQITCHLEIEFETHFSQFLMPTIRGISAVKEQKNVGTKKRYAGLVNNKLVFKGLETVRSDWTEVSKVFQQELYRLVFNEQSPIDYIRSMVADIKSGRFDDKLIYMKKIRRNLQDYVNTPPHINAAKQLNDKLVAEGLAPKYKRGSKIEYVITLDGVKPLQMVTSSLDYDFYIDKQIKPIADDILPFIGTSFEQITSNQLGLF
ncbi:MAG: DNA polymerase II [Colwellia sp.]